MAFGQWSRSGEDLGHGGEAGFGHLVVGRPEVTEPGERGVGDDGFEPTIDGAQGDHLAAAEARAPRAQAVRVDRLMVGEPADDGDHVEGLLPRVDRLAGLTA